MAEYILEGGGVLSADELHSVVNSCTSQCIPTAFLMLGMRPGATTPTVQYYNRLTHFSLGWGYHQVLGGKVFAFSSDIVNGQMSTMKWDRRLYEPVSNNDIVVGTNTLIEDALAADPNVQMVGPFNDRDSGTESVQVCRIVYLPPLIVSLMLEDKMAPR